MRSNRLIAFLVLTVTLPAGAHRMLQSATPAEETPATTIYSSTSLVLADVVVTNKGVPVQGLTESQFHVFEDGKPQIVHSFEEHKASSTNATPPNLVSAPGTYTNRPGYFESSSLVLLLDALNTPLADQMQAKAQMLSFLKDLPTGVPVAIFTLSSRLRPVQGLTVDHSVLTAALRSMRANARPSPVLDPAGSQELESATSDLSSFGDPQQVAASMQQFEADNTAMRTDVRVRLTLQALQELGRYCNGIHGRKNLIWFSGSFPLQLDADIDLNSPLDVMRNYAEEVRETSHLLSAARVAVYPVDDRGLLTLPMVDANYSASSSHNAAGSGGGPASPRRGTLASGTPGFAKDNLLFMKQTNAEHASMMQVAQDTGGWAFLDTNGLQQAMERVSQHGSAYYSLTYKSSAPQLDGRFRRIEVRVDGGKYQLAYRTGYYADDPAKRLPFRSTEASLSAAVAHNGPASTELLFSVKVAPELEASSPPVGSGDNSNNPSRRALIRRAYSLNFDLDGRGLDLAALPDGSRAARVEFIAIAYGRDGKLLNRVGQGFAFHIRPDQYAAAMEKGIPRQLHIDLPPGAMSLRVAVHDLNSNHIGSLEFPFQVAYP
jgi:VWFA-related protein